MVEYFDVSVSKLISIHAPVKGATVSIYFSIVCIDISIHAPVKGATLSKRQGLVGKSHFNPRPREGSDVFGTFMGLCDDYISIHAPVKGATVKTH